MNQLTVIGLGAGEIEQLQLGVYRKLQSAKKVYVRTIEHPVLQSLAEEGIQFVSFDEVYIRNSSFEEVYKEIVDELLQLVENEDVMYAVPGHPLVAEQTVQYLIQAERNGKVKLSIEGGQSFLDPIFGALRIDPIEGFQLLDGTSFSAHEVNMYQHLLIAQVYDTFSASEVKLTLMDKYREDYPVTIVTAAGSSQESLRTVPLYELDRAAELNNLTTIYVPPVQNMEEALREWTTFRQIVTHLRSPEGCPWDREQTHDSLKKYFLEEIHEFLEAVDQEDDDQMIEELGDVLLQIFLHAQIGEDEGYFNLEDVLASISDKMIRRHPHVFGQSTVEDAEEVLQNWQDIKAQEKGDVDAHTSIIDDQYRSTSSLLTSFNYQKKAASVGFDWPDAEGIWSKFEEEWQEFRTEVKNGSKEQQMDEFGDVLFTLVNIARVYKISPEEAMVHANQKFARRFQYVEKCVKEGNRTFQDYSFEELDQFWNAAKKKEGK